MPAIFQRIALTHDQVTDPTLDIERLSIQVKPSDSRAETFIAQYGRRCWEADVLPARTIEQATDAEVYSWLDAKLWNRRGAEIERARAML
jgi:hypothetical protein